MTPDSQAFLELVRGAEDPSAEDQRRVLAAVKKTVASATLGAALLALLSRFGVTPKLCAITLCVGASSFADAPAPLARSAELSRLSAPSAAPARAVWRAPKKITSPEPAPAPTAVLQGPRPAAVAPSLREELAVLSEVSAALQRGDGKAALERLDSHRTNDRELASERMAARVLALCALGKSDDARAARQQFLREHASSPQRSAVLAACR